ncbi:class I SAM-dependent methyltransferase [Flavitalea flava]
MTERADEKKMEHERQVSIAFSRQAAGFDAYNAGNTIIQYKRQRVRDHVLKELEPGSSILELNAGTGEDSLFFAQRGYHVHATDNAPGMLDKLREKTGLLNLHHDRKGKSVHSAGVSMERCSFTRLDELREKGPYDLIFSNFAGLNCTQDLDKVLQFFAPLLRPGGKVILVVMPAFCLWETLLVFKGKFHTAFRRIFSNKGARSHIEGQYFTCWYYPPSYIVKNLKSSFVPAGLEGLCTLVPPSYMEGFPQKYSWLYEWLREKENRNKNRWPWKFIGDYYIITLKKKG